MDPTSKTLTVELGGKRYKLFFNLNAFTTFEEKTGKFFLDFLADLQEAILAVQRTNKNIAEQPGSNATGAAEQYLKVFRDMKIRLSDFHAFLWSAMHDYDGEGRMYWPLTIEELGRLVDINALMQLAPQLVATGTENLPEAKSEDEGSEDEKGKRPTTPKTLTNAVDGGKTFGPSDEEVSSLLTKSSAN